MRNQVSHKLHEINLQDKHLENHQFDDLKKQFHKVKKRTLYQKNEPQVHLLAELSLAKENQKLFQKLMH